MRSTPWEVGESQRRSVGGRRDRKRHLIHNRRLQKRIQMKKKLYRPLGSMASHRKCGDTGIWEGNRRGWYGTRGEPLLLDPTHHRKRLVSFLPLSFSSFSSPFFMNAPGFRLRESHSFRAISSSVRGHC